MRQLYRPVIGLIALVLLIAAACSQAKPVDIDPSFDGAQATIRAANIAFDPSEITLPTGTPLRIILDNQDAGLPHDIRIAHGDEEIARSPTVTGPAQTEVRFGPLAPGTYQLTCTIHPAMKATLTISE
jgi:plastocyanin